MGASPEVSLLSYLSKNIPSALTLTPNQRDITQLASEQASGKIPLTSEVPVVNAYIEPSQPSIPPISRPLVINGNPDSNVRPITHPNNVTAGVGLSAATQFHVTADGVPTESNANPVTSDGPHDITTGTALSDTGVAITGASTAAPTNTASPNMISPTHNLESILANNPIASAVIAGLILVFLMRFMKG